MQTSEIDDEISIIDIVTIIKKRRKSFYIVFLLILVLSVLFTLNVEPRYTSKSVVFIGNVGGVGNIEPAQALVKRLEEEYRVDDSSEAKIVPPYVSQVKFNKKGPSNIVEIHVEDITADGAQLFLTQVVYKLTREHSALFLEAKQKQENLLNNIKNRHSEYTKQLELMNKQINGLEKKNPEQASLVAVEKGKFLTTLPELESQIANLELVLSSIQTKPTKLLRTPTLPRAAKTPKPVLYISIGIFLALLLGVMSTFIIEFISNIKKSISIEVKE